MNGWNFLIDDIAEKIALEEKVTKLREIGKRIDAIKSELEVEDV